MTKALNLLIGAGCLGAIALAFAPVPAPQPPATPFWQLHGAAPAATEVAMVSKARLAARPGRPDGIIVAAR